MASNLKNVGNLLLRQAIRPQLANSRNVANSQLREFPLLAERALPVFERISMVVFPRIVAEVCELIVRFVAIVVATIMPTRTRTNKGKQHEHMAAFVNFSPELTNELIPDVARLIRAPFQCAPVARQFSAPMTALDAPVMSNSVAGEARNLSEFNLRCHSNNVHSELFASSYCASNYIRLVAVLKSLLFWPTYGKSAILWAVASMPAAVALGPWLGHRFFPQSGL